MQFLSILLSFLLGMPIISENKSSPFDNGVVGIQEQAFDDFISNLVVNFKNNMNDGLFPSEDFNFYLNSTSSDNANVTTIASGLQDLRPFTFSINSTIDLFTNSGSLRLDLNFTDLYCTGNYSLQGIASSFIIVNGNGTYYIRAMENKWTLTAPLTINSTGYVNVIWPTEFNSDYTIENVTFNGIGGIDVIGELIQDYLKDVGENVFMRVHRSGMQNFLGQLSTNISNVLKTVTIDEILYGQTSPTPIVQTTPSTMFPSSTVKPDVVIDIGADLADSGWTIPTTNECGYALNLNGFFCNGTPVQVRDPFMGVGFWMSPCSGRCIFHYDNVENGMSFRTLGVRAFYTDATNSSRILVDFEHSSGTSHLEFSNGDFNQIDFTQYGTLKKINVTMENNGPNQFSILDTLTISYL